MAISFDIARSAPRSADAVGVPVYTDGAVPRSLGLNRAALAKLGFEGKVGQTLVVPSADGSVTVAVGMGDATKLTTASLRRSSAALARAAQKRVHIATSIADVVKVDAKSAAQAVVEGIVMADYKFVALKSDKTAPLTDRVTLIADTAKVRPLTAGITRGQALAEAVVMARDLVNSPGGVINARDLAERAVEIGSSAGITVEVFDEHAAAEMGLGGLLGVNRGSTEPPRLIKLTYEPKNATGSVALVGKGITFDSGGLSLKPSDGMITMKSDMTGAAVVLATMSVLKVTKPKVKVVGYMCCTDNMPSGTAMKLGDVLKIRNGKTVEIHNTDAEGRLVLADGLSLAVEDDVDAIVDIATLTGACMVALGKKVAGLMGNNDEWCAQVGSAADRADEPVWRLPLPAEYRKMLDSDVADMKNVGGPHGGALTAGLFLKEFVGETPWVHLDIAGPSWADADDGWLTKGGTACGVRTFIELLDGFSKPNKRKA
ncbi:MAG: leucyl aminopeptidase [Acidimicrobiia bacterium]